MSVTEEQRAAIRARGKVIVSASAGSGKTFVMIERLVDLILGGEDVRRVLAVTFTNKAAAQMKERLRTELHKRISVADEGERERLKEQLRALPLADISTIHSFCARLIRTYFYRAGVDPAFAVLSDDEQEGFAARAMDETFEAEYARADEAFGKLLQIYFRKKKDAGLRRLVLSLHRAVRGRADYREFLESVGSGDDFLRAREYLSGDFCDRARDMIACAEELSSYFGGNPRAGKVCADITEAARRLIAAGDVFEMKKLQKPQISSMPPRTKAAGTELFRLDCLKGLSDGIKKLYAKLEGYGTEEEERARQEEARATSALLARLVLSFDETYSRIKEENGALDYDDLEHFALGLLSDPDILAAVREKYRYLFVDEYQDVNPAQERVLSLIGGEEVFLVGDAKQSIYGFRGSRSEYFTAKTREFPASLLLGENFRSARAVLDAVNLVFSRAMTEETAGIDYARSPMRGGSRYGERDGSVIFHRIPPEKKERAERGIYSVLDQKTDRTDSVGEFVADLIMREKGSEWYDVDANCARTVGYGDIAVLVRKKSGAAGKIVSALSERGIPVTSSAEVNVCDFWEARVVIDWLSYLDNPEQDIPRAGAMLSRAGGFTDAELAAIRMRFPSPYTFRGSCEEYQRRMCDDLSKKLLAFAEKTERLRALMQVRTGAEMINELLSEGLEAEIASKEDGEARLRRVRRLAEWGDGTVNAFLERLKTVSYRVDYSESGGENAVKVVTMHGSKGLEYPVVILADLTSPFHGPDRSEVYCTEAFGFAPKSYDRENKIVYETMLRRASAVYEDREELKGELNLLYVAMTRAKYRLHMLFPECEHAPAPCFAKRLSDLIDFAACEGYFGAETASEPPLPRESLVYRPDEGEVGRILSVYGKKYRFEESTLLPVKSSATELLREEESAARPSGGATVEEGLAYHAFLEHVRFGKSAAEELARMRADGTLNAEQLALLDEEKLVRILALPALQGLAEKRIRREQNFLVSLPAREIPALKTDSDDEIVIQGAIDLLIEDEEGYLIVDYKFSARDEASIKEHYAPQLDLYRRAVSKITGAAYGKIRARILNIRELYEVAM